MSTIARSRFRIQHGGVGTYSGYAEFFDGYAFAVEINIGAHSEPDSEQEELRERQAQARARVAGAQGALAHAVEHFRAGEHPYRRHLALLDRATRDYEGPGPGTLWSSEQRTRGAKLPLSLLVEAREPAAADDGPLTLSPATGFDRDPELHVYLYLQADVSYALREVIDGHFVAAQFSAGGLLAELPACEPVTATQLGEAFGDAHAGRNRHTVARLLRMLAANRELVLESAADPSAPSAPIPQLAAAFLEPSRFTPELIAAATRQRNSAMLLASTIPDRVWQLHEPALRGVIE